MRLLSLVLLLIVITCGCSSGKKELCDNPLSPAGYGISSDLTTPIGMFEAFELNIDKANMKYKLAEKRTVDLGESYTVSGKSFFSVFPCVDCLAVTGIGYANGNVALDFKIRHPFPKGDLSKPPTGKNRLDLDLFDPALIVFPKSVTPTYFDIVNRDVYDGIIANPDGYTIELSSLLGNLALLPYVLIVDDSESIPPANTHNKFEMGGSKEFKVEFPMTGGENLTFDLYLTFGYGSSAKLPDRLNPKYYNPEFNRKPAWKVEVIPPNGTNPPAMGNTWDDGDSTTPYNVTVKVYDWQIGANVDPALTNQTDIRENSDVANVGVLIPGMNSTPPSVDGSAFESGGTGMPDHPLVYKVPVKNENLLYAGKYLGMVKVTDKRNPKSPAEGYDYLINSPDGVALQPFEMPEYASYQMFYASVAPNTSVPHFVDVTPPYLNLEVQDLCAEGDYAYLIGVNNGLHIYNVSDPSHPVFIKRIDIDGDLQCISVQNQYACIGSYFKDSTNKNKLDIVDISNPASASIIKTVIFDEFSLNENLDVFISGNYVYIANGFDLEIVDINPPASLHSVKTIDIYGASKVIVSNGYAYVANGEGISVVDIGTPETASIIATINWVSAMQDFAVKDDYLYFVNAYGELSIIDISTPSSAHTVKTVSNCWGNIDIYNGYAYIPTGSGMIIVDVDPATSAYIVNSTNNITGYMINISDGYAYMSTYDIGFEIADIRQAESPVHSCYVSTLGEPIGFEIDNNHLYIGDHYAMKIIDISSPESASIIKYVPSCAVDCAYISQGLAYVGSSCLRIVDIDPPASASVINYVILPYDANAMGICVKNGYAHIATYCAYSGTGYYQIADVDPPQSASIIKTLTFNDFVRQVGISGNFSFLIQGSQLVIVDISTPESAFITKSVELTSNAADLSMPGDGYAYITGNKELIIVDIEPPENSSILKRVQSSKSTANILIKNGIAYVGTEGSYPYNNDPGYIQTFDVNPPQSAHYLNAFMLHGSLWNMRISGNYLYLRDNSADCNNGLKIYRIE